MLMLFLVSCIVFNICYPYRYPPPHCRLESVLVWFSIVTFSVALDISWNEPNTIGTEHSVFWPAFIYHVMFTVGLFHFSLAIINLLLICRWKRLTVQIEIYYKSVSWCVFRRHFFHLLFFHAIRPMKYI